MSKKEIKKLDVQVAIENLENQKRDFVELYDELASKPQTEATRDKLWELTEIIVSIEEDMKAFKDGTLSI